MNRGLQGLSAANTYSGGTTINNQGTIRAINTTGSATGTGIVTVNAGGTLDGTGRIFSGNTGPIPVILNGGTVSVGGGPRQPQANRCPHSRQRTQLRRRGHSPLVVGQSGGIPSAGRVDLNISTFDRNTGGAATDVMTIRLFNDGTLDLSGSTNYTITVLTYDTLGSGLTPFTNEAHPANFAATAINFSFASDPLITLNGGELSLTFTPLPVPEPATVLGVAACALGLGRPGPPEAPSGVRQLGRETLDWNRLLGHPPDWTRWMQSCDGCPDSSNTPTAYCFGMSEWEKCAMRRAAPWDRRA